MAPVAASATAAALQLNIRGGQRICNSSGKHVSVSYAVHPCTRPIPSRVTSGWVADARTYTHGRERGRQTTTVVATAFPISLPPSVITIDLCSSDSRGGQV